MAQDRSFNTRPGFAGSGSVDNSLIRRRPAPESVQVPGEEFLRGLRSVDAVNVRQIVRYLDSLNGYLDGVSIGVLAVGGAAIRPKDRKQFPDGVDLEVHTSSISSGEENGQDRLAASAKIIDGLQEYSAAHSFEFQTVEKEWAGADRLIVLTPSEGLPIRVSVTHPFMYPDYPRYVKGLQANLSNKDSFSILI